ncbi:hypothetical protein BDR05DRAFT_1014992 [Suillus weaverae]|nr:hypothetical protein BDR05DRAFT_1014992 [Suillus weaverae]
MADLCWYFAIAAHCFTCKLSSNTGCGLKCWTYWNYWLECGRIFEQNHLLSSVRREIKQLLTVPASIQSTIPLQTLSVTQLLDANFIATLNHNLNSNSITLSTCIPHTHIPDNFLMWTVPPLHLATQLLDQFGQAWFDRYTSRLLITAFFMCKAGKDFNLLFPSLTSLEALQLLSKVQRSDPAGWDRIATVQYKLTAIDAEVAAEDDDDESLFDETDNGLDASDVPLDTLTDYLASEGLQTYPGCKLDVANGSLASATQSKIYNIGEGDIDGEADSIPKFRKISVTVMLNSFNSWRLVTHDKAIFLLSPETEFPGLGVDKSSTINYKDLFFQYKKLLITKWETKWIKNIMTNINCYIFGVAKLSTSMDPAGAEDFSEEINHAMLALDMETDSEEDTPPVLSALSSVPSAAPVLSAPSLAPRGPNLITQPITHLEESASRAAIHTNDSNTSVNAVLANDTDEADDMMELGGGQAKAKNARGRKVTAQGPTHHGHSRKA